MGLRATAIRSAGRAEIDWSDLAGQRLCLLTPDMQNRRIINQNLHAAGVSAVASIQSNSTVVLVAHVEAGEWGTVLPRQQAEFLAAGRAVRVIPIRPIRPPHSVGLIAPVSRAAHAGSRGAGADEPVDVGGLTRHPAACSSGIGGGSEFRSYRQGFGRYWNSAGMRP